MNQASSQSQSSRNAQKLFSQKTPEPKKSKFFKITLTIAVIVVLILLYKTFASTGVGTASNISLNFDTNTIKQQDGKIECIEDDRILQWHGGLKMWECKKPTSAVFGELDKNNVKVNSSGSLECKEDNKTLIWDDDQWACGDAGKSITTENGLEIDSNDKLSIESPTCSSIEKLIWNGNEFICEEDIDDDEQTLSFNNDTLSISNGNDVDLSDLKQDLDFNESNGELSISNGNTVDLDDLKQELSYNLINNELSISDGNTINLDDLDDSTTISTHTSDTANPHSTNFLNLTDTINSYTEGSLLFTSSSGVTEDNGNLFWDDGENRLGIGQSTPNARIHVKGSTSDDTAYALKVDNSSDSNLFSIRNDGWISVNGASQIDTESLTALNHIYIDNTYIGRPSSATILIGDSSAIGSTGYGGVIIGGLGAGRYIGSNPHATIIGAQAAQNASAADVTAIGYSAGRYSDAANSTFLGTIAGRNTNAGGSLSNTSDSLYLGAYTTGESSIVTNEIVIGYDAEGNGDNTATLGNNSITETHLKGVVVQGTSSSAPTGIEGGIYYNSTDNHFYGYNGTSWVQLDN